MSLEQSERQKKMSSIPHLINLNEDPMLSRVIYHFLEQGKPCAVILVQNQAEAELLMVLADKFSVQDSVHFILF